MFVSFRLFRRRFSYGKLLIILLSLVYRWLVVLSLFGIVLWFGFWWVRLCIYRGSWWMKNNLCDEIPDVHHSFLALIAQYYGSYFGGARSCDFGLPSNSFSSALFKFLYNLGGGYFRLGNFPKFPEIFRIIMKLGL